MKIGESEMQHTGTRLAGHASWILACVACACAAPVLAKGIWNGTVEPAEVCQGDRPEFTVRLGSPYAPRHDAGWYEGQLIVDGKTYTSRIEQRIAPADLAAGKQVFKLGFENFPGFPRDPNRKLAGTPAGTLRIVNAGLGASGGVAETFELRYGDTRAARVSPYPMPSAQEARSGVGEVRFRIHAEDGCLPDEIRFSVDFGRASPGHGRIPGPTGSEVVIPSRHIMWAVEARAKADGRPLEESELPRRIKVSIAGKDHEWILPVKLTAIGRAPVESSPDKPAWAADKHRIADTAATSARMEQATNRLGGDYTSRELATPQQCQGACANDVRCKAWTWVKPGLQGPQAKCWLKHQVPAPSRNDCCISGVR